MSYRFKRLHKVAPKKYRSSKRKGQQDDTDGKDQSPRVALRLSRRLCRHFRFSVFLCRDVPDHCSDVWQGRGAGS
ncbi:hypothetical protein ACFOOJ_20200 [Sphingobium xenophagum]